MKEKRTEAVIVKVTATEKKILLKMAEEANLTISSYIRMVLLAGKKEK